MKYFIARLGGIALCTAALAACSGVNQSVPAVQSPALSQPAARQQAPAKAAPVVVAVTSADRAWARTFRAAGAPHIMPPVFKHSAMRRPNAVGYPFDMTCQTAKCPVMNASVAYNVYVSLDGKTCTTESCWGDPEEFLKALAGSSMAGLVQQYTGGAPTAYTFGGSMAVKYPHPYTNTFYFEDLITILAAAAHHFKAVGLNAEYNLFLPKGVDTCFDQTASCYSPDNLSSFAFCAYHTAVFAAANTPIVFSVEPYQNATYKYQGKTYYGCQNSTVPAGTNRLNSGTASTLSHESFESWSDPLPNTGYFNAIFGAEVGDVCAYWSMAPFTSGSASWWIQQEYSNSVHGCNNGP